MVTSASPIARVGEHVPGVGDQGQRGGYNADDHLDQHEPDQERKTDCQVASVCVSVHAVGVPFMPFVGVQHHALYPKKITSSISHG
jgi:hypothetical protein